MWSDEEFDDEQVSWKRRLGRIAVGVVLVGGLGTAVYFIYDSMSHTERHAVQTVTRITLPPPPPPPPPPPKPPEPEKVVETPKIQEPKVVEKTPDKPPEKSPPKPQAPPGSPLTAEAGAGANPYGLGAGDGSGNVVGGGGDIKAMSLSYARIVSLDVQAALRRNDKLRSVPYSAELYLWLDTAGRVTRVQLASSSGNPTVDSAITSSLNGLEMRDPPPKDMVLPVRLRPKNGPG